MNKKVLMSIFVLIVCAAMISAATMAWFTDSDDAGEAVFTAGTVSIEAGRKIITSDGEAGSSDNVYGSFYPARVIDFMQGSAKAGNVKSERSNPKAVLTLGTGQNEANFFSLGFGGWMILEFDHALYEPELVIVVEDTWGGSYPLETADVFVSMTGEEDSWIYVGEANNENLRQNQTYSEFKFEDLDKKIPYVKYVKVVDTTKLSDFDDYSTDPKTVDGFDLNTVELRGVTSEEDNWNPGDCNLRVYTIINTGTKGINLRGKLTGSWYEFNGTEWEPWTPNPDLGVVTISLADASSGWEKQGDYFYYVPSIPGTYSGASIQNRTVELKVKVCLAGEDTDNQYQGKRYIVSAVFEAIQSSNGAAAAEGWYIPPQSVE